MKICVYAIAKNEMKFIDRWYNSVKSADYICVLDTGSTDGSFEKFSSLGIIVEQKKYDNFRFDTARNDSMKLIPKDADVCVCVDIDEYFLPGWTDIIKSVWKDDIGQIRYRYTWNFNPDGSEGIVFMADKIHKNGCYNWVNPVHEVLSKTSKNNLRTIDLPAIRLYHKADNTKSRASYLPLLELSVKENPTNDRNMHYLGREYFFKKDYKNAIKTLKKHLCLKTSCWDAERSASYRYIAESYQAMNKPKLCEKNLLLSLAECNRFREPFYELGVFYFNNKQYLKSAIAFLEMLKITNRELNYMSNPACWGSLPYDYLSMCFYYLKNYKKAVIYAQSALTLSNDIRIKRNLEVFKNLAK